MLFKTAQIKEPPLLRIEPFRGMNASGSSTQINQSESPDMLNMNIDEKGALNKRIGYERVMNLGDGVINGMFLYRKSSGEEIFLVSHGGKLYKSGIPQKTSELSLTIPTFLSDISPNDVSFFEMNNKSYIMDTVKFFVYDGTTISEVTPYIPTIQMSKPPQGGGTAYEDFNLIGNKFKDSFSGTGTDTVYQMSLTGLDSTPVTAQVGTTTINEGSGLTVDRVNGKITFVTAPVLGTNNVIITAGKTVSGYPEKIKNCTFSIAYGGSNDTRVFIAGNKNMPEYAFRCGLQDPTYWPENGYYRFTDEVKGFSKQYDYLVVERSTGKNQVTYSLDNSTGKVSFPSKPINDEVGCIAGKSIQIIDNNPVSLSKNGLYAITATNIINERNVVHISQNIDRRMLLEPGLEEAVSVDFDKKYWLCLNGNVYILDYTQKSQANPFGEWYIYDNIAASSFLEMGGFLYFASSKDGLIYKFIKDTTNVNAYSDDGEPIVAYWKSKTLTFNADEMRKYIDCIYLGLHPHGKTSVDVSYESDKKSASITGNQEIKFAYFDFADINFSNFSFYVSQFPKVFKRKVKAKKVTVFQITLQNDKLNEGLTVLSLGIKFTYDSYIK
jgi:hypothetical protein